LSHSWTAQVAGLVRFSYDHVPELFYRSEDVSDRGEALDLCVAHADLYRVIVTERMLFLTKLDDLLGQYDRVNLFFRRVHAV
jgi:hypothetical protein